MTLRASSLLALTVLVDDIVVGIVVDLVVDQEVSRVLGFEVRCGDDEHRFLPYSAAPAGKAAVTARTPLALLDPPELAFYRDSGSSLRALRGTTVHANGGAARRLDDLEVSVRGDVTGVFLGAATQPVVRTGLRFEVPVPPASSV